MLPLNRIAALRRMMEYGMSFYPKAEWQPGPANKQNGGVNRCVGVVCHSMVGMYPAALGELMKPERRASWGYSVLQSGGVIVHYHDQAQTWHAGSARNNDLIGIEHEGGLSPHSEPLTPAQLAASVDLVRWLSKFHGFPMERKNGLHEHNEVSGEPTACPSKRIPWASYTPVVEEEDVAIELVWNPDFGRMYVIGQGVPLWIADPQGAAGLQAAYGAPKRAVNWAALKSLGAT